MSNVLRPFPDFEGPEIAQSLHQIAPDNRQQLEVRNYAGALCDYTQGLAHAEARVAYATRQHRLDQVAHYAIVNSAEDIVGAASLSPRTPLKRQRDILWAQKYHHASPYMRLWADINELDILKPAWEELVVKARRPIRRDGDGVAWTLEPAVLPITRAYHEAITDAGLVEVGTRRYDDGEHRMPPQMTLYANLTGGWEWTSRRKKEAPLR